VLLEKDMSIHVLPTAPGGCEGDGKGEVVVTISYNNAFYGLHGGLGCVYV